MVLQLRKECELMQQRAETAEGVVERERGLHRRELRRRAKELADMQEDLVQVSHATSCLRVEVLQKLQASGAACTNAFLIT